MMFKSIRCLFVALTVLLLGSGWAYAAEYPTKPIRMILPFGAGGTLDVIGRLIAAEMGGVIGQNVVVENRPGASGSIGAAAVAQAAPDGYTLLFTAALYSQLPTLMRLPFDAEKDLQPVYNAMANAQIVFVNPAFPARSLAEFVQYVKANPGLRYGTGGGDRSALHVAFELLANGLGTQLVHVGYKGAAEVMQAVVAGHLMVGIGGPQPGLALAADGKLRTLAVLGSRRSKLLPDVPALSEAGVPSLDFYVNWLGFFVPRGTPKEIVTELNKQLAAATRSPKVVERARQLAMEPEDYNAPEQFAAQISREIEQWKEVTAKVKFDK
jgi:tripartite-type tricarboxylate transporter receptor subunit TctC